MGFLWKMIYFKWYLKNFRIQTLDNNWELIKYQIIGLMINANKLYLILIKILIKYKQLLLNIYLYENLFLLNEVNLKGNLNNNKICQIGFGRLLSGILEKNKIYNLKNCKIRNYSN